MTFEAAWSIAGAICVAHTRVPELATLDALQKRCPNQLQVPYGQCTQRAAFQANNSALVGNRSFARN
jgi:hypothetical protein